MDIFGGNTCLIALIIIVIIVAVVFLMRRRGASSAAKQITDSASSAASSATSAVKDTASSATGAAAGAAAGAASMTKDAASSAAGAAQGAASSAGGAAAGAAGAAAGAMGAAAGAMDLGQMGDMLGGIMNGNMQLDANSPLGKMITPMADDITGKIGLPKGVGAMVVTFALAAITKMMQAKKGGQGSAPMQGGMNADEVLGKLNSGGGIDAGSLQSMGLTGDLAKKTGLSDSQASQGLEMAMGMLSAGMSGKKDFNGMALPDMSMLTNMLK